MHRVLLPSLLVACSAAAQSPLRFEPAQEPLQVGPMAGLPEVADLDGDGHLDVVLACGPCCGMDPDPRSGHVQVLLGDGTGGLRYAGDAIKVGDSALRVAVGDIDEDGHPDVACIHHNSYELAVLLGDGAGGMTRRDDLSFDLHDADRPHVHSVILVDVNHDQHLDVVASLIHDHAIAVHLGDGAGHFSPSLGSPYFAHRHPYEQLVAYDLNGDGHLDIACTDVSGNGVSVLLGSGTGMFASSRFRFAAHTRVGEEVRPMALALGDFTGDGHPDMVATLDEAPQVLFLTNDGKGDFTLSGDNPLSTAKQTWGVRVADFDRDGKLDFVTGGTSVSLGRGDGTFAESVAVRSDARKPYVAVGDFDEDGRPDLVCSSYDDGAVQVLLNRK